MIASPRGLYALAVLAALAVALAILDGPGVPRDRALVAGLEVASITKLVNPGFALVRRGAGFAWRDPPGDVDASTLDRLITALRGARWHRRASTSAAGASRDTLVIETTRDTHRIELGEPLVGADQAWLVVDGEALLVDSWVATALFPAPLELRVRRPFAGVERAIEVEITGAGPPLVLAGTPALTRLRLEPNATLRLAPAITARIAAALGAVENLALPPSGPPRATDAVTIAVRGAQPMTVATVGTCAKSLVRLATSAGEMCIAPAAWAELLASFAALRAPVAELVDRRPAAAARLVTLVDGTQVDLVKIPAGFDPVRVAALAAALATPAELTTGEASPTGTLLVDGEPLALYTDGSVQRTNEPVRLLPDRAARALLRAAAETFRDPRLWQEDPTTIAAVTIDGKTFTRGATLGEWTSTADPRSIDAVVAQLATPTSLGPVSPPLPAHVVTLRIRRPDAGEREHTLTLAADCRGTTEGRSVQLPSALCAAVQRAH